MSRKFEEPKFEKTEFEAVAYLKEGSGSNISNKSSGRNKRPGWNNGGKSNKCARINPYELPV